MQAKDINILNVRPGNAVVVVDVEADGAPVQLIMDRIPTADEVLAALANYPYPPGPSKLSPEAPVALVDPDFADEFNVGGALSKLGWEEATPTTCYVPKVEPGYHSYVVTFATADGESLPSALVEADACTIFLTDYSKVELTVPLGPTGTLARKIYRSLASATPTLNPQECYLHMVLDDNTTQDAVVDNKPDVTSLVPPPTENTLGIEDTDFLVDGVPVERMFALELGPEPTQAVFSLSEEPGFLTVSAAEAVAPVTCVIKKAFSSFEVVDVKALLAALPAESSVGLALTDDTGAGMCVFASHVAGDGLSVTAQAMVDWALYVPEGESAPKALGLQGFPRFLALAEGTDTVALLYSYDGLNYAPASDPALLSSSGLSHVALYFVVPPVPDTPELVDGLYPPMSRVLVNAVRLRTRALTHGGGPWGGPGGGPLEG